MMDFIYIFLNLPIILYALPLRLRQTVYLIWKYIVLNLKVDIGEM